MRSAAARAAALLVGLIGYGFSMAVMVRAGLGLDPWDVFHQGLARHTGMTIGIASAVVGVAVLLAWIPLRNRPGIGTIAHVIVIVGTLAAAVLAVGWLLGGTVGVGTVLYAFGIGPLVQLFLRITPRRVLAVSGWASVTEASDLGVKSGAMRNMRNKSRRNREFIDVS